jgi:Fe-S oxidoreductase
LLWTLKIDEAERRRRERRPVMLQPYNEPLGEGQAREEAERCLDCQCGLCVKDCEFLARHCRSPKDLARRVRDGLGSQDTLKMVYSCNICSLCANVCPENLDTGALLVEARREAVRLGRAPLPEHKATVSFFRTGISRTFSLLMSEPGRGRSKRLFFPGCRLPSFAPEHTIEIYDVLRRNYRGTGVLLYCCGAPVETLGMENEFGQTREALRRMAESVGAEELITVCPGCTSTLRERAPELRITSAWELLAGTWRPPRRRDGVVVSVHDSCRTRGDPGIHVAVRRLLEQGGSTIADLEYSGLKTRCCGFGGRIRGVDPELSSSIANRRAGESSLPMVTYCTDCRMALAGCGKEAIHLLDFLLCADWQKAMRSRPPGSLVRNANRFRAKWSFKRLRPLGAE